MPYDYALLQLCKDVYHCTPAELAEQDADTVHLHMWMLSTVEEFRPKEKGAK